MMKKTKTFIDWPVSDEEQKRARAHRKTYEDKRVTVLSALRLTDPKASVVAADIRTLIQYHGIDARSAVIKVISDKARKIRGDE